MEIQYGHPVRTGAWHKGNAPNASRYRKVPPNAEGTAAETMRGRNGNINDGDVIDDHTFGMLVGSTAQDIIEGDIVFDNNPDVSQWMAERDLYSELDRDSVTRNSHTDYLDFYSDRLTEPMGELYKTEQKINEIMQIENPLQIVNAIQTTKLLNNSVQTSLPYEENLKNMNSLLFKVMEQNRSLLTQSEKEQIYDLAHSCPAEKGMGVYKARQLNSYYEPLAVYNDYELCAPANKGGKGMYDDLFALLNGEEQINSQNSQLSEKVKQEVLIYPVPSINSLNIKFRILNNDNALLNIYDFVGRLLSEQKISQAQLNTIDLTNYANGLYTYQIETNFAKYSGKFNVIK